MQQAPTIRINIATADERRDAAIEIIQQLAADALQENWDTLVQIAKDSAGDGAPTIAASLALKVILETCKVECHADISFSRKFKEEYCDERDFRQQKLPLPE